MSPSAIRTIWSVACLAQPAPGSDRHRLLCSTTSFPDPAWPPPCRMYPRAAGKLIRYIAGSEPQRPLPVGSAERLPRPKLQSAEPGRLLRNQLAINIEQPFTPAGIEDSNKSTFDPICSRLPRSRNQVSAGKSSIFSGSDLPTVGRERQQIRTSAKFKLSPEKSISMVRAGAKRTYLTVRQGFPKLPNRQQSWLRKTLGAGSFLPVRSKNVPSLPPRRFFFNAQQTEFGAVAKRLRQRIANPPPWVRLPPAPF